MDDVTIRGDESPEELLEKLRKLLGMPNPWPHHDRMRHLLFEQARVEEAAEIQRAWLERVESSGDDQESRTAPDAEQAKSQPAQIIVGSVVHRSEDDCQGTVLEANRYVVAIDFGGGPEHYAATCVTGEPNGPLRVDTRRGYIPAHNVARYIDDVRIVEETDRTAPARQRDLEERLASIPSPVQLEIERLAGAPGTWQANPAGVSGRILRGYRHWRSKR